QQSAHTEKAKKSPREVSLFSTSLNDEPATPKRTPCSAKSCWAREELQPVSRAHCGRSVRLAMARISSSLKPNSFNNSQISGKDNSAQPSVENPQRKGSRSSGAVIDIECDNGLQRFTAVIGAKVFQGQRPAIAPPIAGRAAQV